MLHRTHALLCNQARLRVPHAATVVPPPKGTNNAAAALQRHSSSNQQPHCSCLCKCTTAGSSNVGQQEAAPEPAADAQQRAEFKPRVLTTGLRRAATIQALEGLWHSFQHQFNSYHFSVLMQQLTKLHDAVSTGLAAQQNTSAQQQHQASDASLAELEQELGHLLNGNSGSQQGQDAAPAESRSRVRRISWRTDQQQESTAAASLSTAAAAGPAATRPPLQVDRPQWRPPAGSSSSSAGRVRGRQHHTPRQPHQQDITQQQVLQRIHRLALTAAAAALKPGRAEALDHRALVMVARNLAKMQLHNSSILQQLLRVLGPDVLPELDAQQLTNLIWSLGSCASSGQEDRSPYRTLLVPAVLGRPVPVMAVAAAAAASTTVSSAAGDGSRSTQWEQVAAVAEPPGTDSTDELEMQAAAAAASMDAFVDAVSIRAPAAGSSSRLKDQPPADWLSAAADALMQRLPACTSQGVAMALWGFAQLGFSPPATWWRRFWGLTQGGLPSYSAQDLALLICGIGKLGPKVGAA